MFSFISFQLASFTSILAAASAGQIFSQPQAEHYAKAADIYQSAVEYQPAVYSGQSQAFTGHNIAYQERPSAEKSAKILSYHSENDGQNYHYAYETENGKYINETVKMPFILLQPLL